MCRSEKGGVMNRRKFAVIVMLLMSISAACTPSFVGKDLKADLIVTDLSVAWDDMSKEATAEIANVGNKDAGEFMVYFNGEENPISPNRRPQVREKVSGLSKGNSIILKADFAPLAHPDNNNLENVYEILVLADPKNMVEESDENNNEKGIPLP